METSKVLIISSILNLIVAAIKLVTGITFSFSTLIADSIQSFIDFFTDIVSLVANKIGKRRANKTYPFGYGQVYYLSNILTGLLLFLIGVFIIYQVFAVDNKFVPSMKILLILLFILVLKSIVIVLLLRCGNKTKNELLIESYKESKADLISTCVVIVVLLISYFEKYLPGYINIDKLGSIGMAAYVFYTSIKMIVSNVNGILINDEKNEEIKEEIKEALKRIKGVRITNIKIIKMSYYYSVFLQIDVDDSITIKDFIAIHDKIKRKLKATNKLIKYIDIEPM
ncbi:MAG: cation diffusion facilitator family transporter [Bacilli bacterium]|nr:cation diffusion facilitator family transporter [Bacilli bacterium]